jgi:hypothetical protein
MADEPRWIAITVDDLNDAKIAKLVTALRTKALGDSQTDPTPRIIQAVVNRIRRKVANNRKNRLDADETKIPKSLKKTAVVLTLAELKGRLEMALTADETKAVDKAEDDLKEIANGDAIEEPDTPIAAPVQDTVGSPSVTDRRREKLNQRRGL